MLRVENRGKRLLDAKDLCGRLDNLSGKESFTGIIIGSFFDGNVRYDAGHLGGDMENVETSCRFIWPFPPG